MEFVLITGASTGIGYDTSRYLIERGFHILGSVRKQSDADRITKELGGQFHPLIFDVTDGERIRSSAEEARHIVGAGSLVGIVNNAGIVVNGPLLHIPIEEVQQQLNVNVLGQLRVIQAFFPLLNESNDKDRIRRIVNVGSISGLFASPFLGPYCMSKYALEALNDSLRRECLIFPNIDVVMLEPGAIITPIWDKAINEEPKYLDTPYGPFMSMKTRMIKSSQKQAISTDAVAKTIHRMLTRKKYPVRKIIMKQKWLFNVFRYLVPARMVDANLKKSMLSGKKFRNV